MALHLPVQILPTPFLISGNGFDSLEDFDRKTRVAATDVRAGSNKGSAALLLSAAQTIASSGYVILLPVLQSRQPAWCSGLACLLPMAGGRRWSRVQLPVWVLVLLNLICLC